jgi:hypothetical protein
VFGAVAAVALYFYTEDPGGDDAETITFFIVTLMAMRYYNASRLWSDAADNTNANAVLAAAAAASVAAAAAASAAVASTDDSVNFDATPPTTATASTGEKKQNRGVVFRWFRHCAAATAAALLVSFLVLDTLEVNDQATGLVARVY